MALFTFHLWKSSFGLVVQQHLFGPSMCLADWLHDSFAIILEIREGIIPALGEHVRNGAEAAE